MSLLSFLYILMISVLVVMISVNFMLFLRIRTIWRYIKLAYVFCGIIVLGSTANSMAQVERVSEEHVLLIGILVIITMLSGSIVSWSKVQVSEFTLKQAQNSIEHLIVENGIDNGN